MKKEVIKHLKGDIKNFYDEASDDKKLIKKLKSKKMPMQSSVCLMKSYKKKPKKKK